MCVYWNFTDLDSVCLQLVKHIRIYSDSMESLCPEYIEIDVPCFNKPLSLLQDLSTRVAFVEYADWDVMFKELWELRILSAEREGGKDSISQKECTVRYVKGEYVCEPSINANIQNNLIDLLYKQKLRNTVVLHVNTDTLQFEIDNKKFFRLKQKLKL